MKAHDLVVIGGGVAGTMAVLAAAAQGLDVAWIDGGIGPEHQSDHWHGHLHRGRLYDPIREAGLIEELAENTAFWWSDAVRPFHEEIDTIAIGPDERWAENFRRRLASSSEGTSGASYLRSDIFAIRTDEAILDGPAFLDAAWQAAAAGSLRLFGRCTRLQQSADGLWRAEVDGSRTPLMPIHGRAVILATGTFVPELIPPSLQLDRQFSARLSRMLVFRGALPRTAAILPSRSAGGLFFASREIPGLHSSASQRAWLISDGFSSPGMSSPGALTDGWWTCSVIERLRGFVREDVFEDVVVGGYLAPKSRLASSPTEVPSQGFAIDRDRTFVALTPSKWSTAPTSAIKAVQALIPAATTTKHLTKRQNLLERMSELIGSQTSGMVAPFTETWQTVSAWVPFATLTTPGLKTLESAASIFDQETERVGASSS